MVFGLFLQYKTKVHSLVRNLMFSMAAKHDIWAIVKLHIGKPGLKTP